MNKIIIPILILVGCNSSPNNTISEPKGKVIIDGEPYTMISGDYKWKENNIEISAKSKLDSNELANLFKTVEVDKGDTLKFEIEKNPFQLWSLN